MKKFLNKIIVFFMAMIVTVSYSFFSGGTVQAAEKSTKITIYHTNDMHGELEDIAYVKGLKNSTSNSILVDAGDCTQGSALTTFSNGAAAISLMNYAEYDGMTLGNHEFDYGVDTALVNAEYASFPVVAANVFTKEGKLLLDGVNGNNGQNFIVEREGKKIGFFGLTTQESSFKSNPLGLDGTQFTDIISTAQMQIDILKANQCDVIVALAHVGVDTNSNPTTETLAQSVNGLDLIIDGHSHTQYEKTVNGVVIAQTGTKLANIGKIEITFEKNGKKVYNSELVAKEKYQKEVSPDAVCNAVYHQYQDLLKPILSMEIGNTTESLLAYAGDSWRVCRLEETVMGDIVADSMKAYGKELVGNSPNGGKDIPIVALQNGGGVRADIAAGIITYEDVLNVLPYNNTLGARMVTPHQLYAALENGVSTLKLDTETGFIGGYAGRYPQISGMRIVVDISRQAYDPEHPESGEGNRVLAVYLLGEDGTEELLNRGDDEGKIALVSNSFEIAGGDGYQMLSELPFIAESAKLDCDVLADYIREISNGGPFTFGTTQGRVTLIQKTEGTYDASINMKDSAFTGGTHVLVSIDGGAEKTLQVALDGKLYIEQLPYGAHTIDVRLNENDEKTGYFVSNISGANTR